MIRITRLAAAAFGLLFALLGLGFWAAPERLGERFGVDPLNVLGLSTLRADFGAMFLTLSGLSLLGAWRNRREPLVAAAAILGLAVVGRLIAWAASGSLSGVVPSLAVEVVGVAVLALHVRLLAAAETAPSRGGGRGLLIAAAVAGVALAGAFAALMSPSVDAHLFDRAAHGLIGRNNNALLNDDAVRVGICGTSAPLPSRDRAKACVTVFAGGRFYVVDSGPESVKNLMLWGLPLERIGGVLITHFHSDHIGDLGELNLQTWVQGRPAPLAVYGGPGVEQVVAGFNEAYALDQGYRTAHHTAAIADPATWPMVAHPVTMAGPPTPALDRTAVVLDQDGLKITAIETNHHPAAPAYAYRFDYKGRSVVVTGDTTEHPPLIKAATGADLLVSEALNRQMIRTMEGAARDVGRPRVAHIMHDIQSYHIAPTEAADMANKAGVRLLVLYHLLPAPDNFVMRRLFVAGLDKARHGAWDLASDGSLYTLPLNSTTVRIGKVPQ